jgi:hypothetical protein
MSVVINLASNDYIGSLKAAASTVNGVFVTANYAAGTAAVVPDTTTGDGAGLLLVANVNTAIDEQGVDDATMTTATGEYLRLKALHVGNIFTTDQFGGTYGSINVGDKFAVGANGQPVAIGARTPKLTLQVKEKTTLHGNSALKFVVLSV